MVRVIGFLLLFVTVGVMAYIRLAPSDPARWHVPVAVRETTDLADGAVRVVPGGQAELHRLAQAMAAADRTRVLSGTVADGRITYISRSRVFGFPDYTTLETSDGEVRAFARLRFGGSDLGVNAARLDRVFAAAGL